MTLNDLLQTAAKPSAPLPLVEAQIATLREAFERYSAPCPFRPGDIVSPRKGFGYRDEGTPHIVLEVAEVPYRPFEITQQVTPYSSAYGIRLDVRVANFCKTGDVDAFWQESWRLEAFTGAEG